MPTIADNGNTITIDTGSNTFSIQKRNSSVSTNGDDVLLKWQDRASMEYHYLLWTGSNISGTSAEQVRGKIKTILDNY